MGAVDMAKILTETVDTIAKCTSDAEAAVLAVKAGYADEETITSWFRDKLSATLGQASDSGKISRAFAGDLKRIVGPQAWRFQREVQAVATGLVAEVIWHSRQNEGRKSGGDMGLVIAQPQVCSDFMGGVRIMCQGNRTGLLVQAKRRQKLGKWGKFTPRQRELLPARMDYLSLLLYDHAKGLPSSLLPFRWQLCQGSKFRQVEGWLEQDKVPCPQSGESIIRSLGNGRIGTKDQQAIKDIIEAASDGTMVIRVDWPGGPPKAAFRILNEVTSKQHGKQGQRGHVPVTRSN